MIEVHPFKPFVPRNVKYLMLGSFTGRMTPNNNYDWYYGTKRNQFWNILRGVYDLPLISKTQKEKLFSELKIALTDVIYGCERKRGSNLDNNLINITYNTENIDKILQSGKINKIFFTSRYVEKTFRKLFKDFIFNNKNIELITLPSPSPRYAKLKLTEKVRIYKNLLPGLNW